MFKKFIPTFVKTLLSVAFIIICGHAFAQGGTDTTGFADSAAVAIQTNAGTLKVVGFAIPGWLQNIFIAVLTILPAIQLILKRIPTDSSVKITGIVGKILDAFTFFQSDIKTDGTTHA